MNQQNITTQLLTQCLSHLAQRLYLQGYAATPWENLLTATDVFTQPDLSKCNICHFDAEWDFYPELGFDNLDQQIKSNKLTFKWVIVAPPNLRKKIKFYLHIKTTFQNGE